MNFSNYCVETKDLTKQYPGTKALDNVNFNAVTGTVNAIVGENGAGKSTLMKILAGNIKASAGEIYIQGEKVELNNVDDARKCGICIIHQELNLFPNLTVSENIFIGKPGKNKIIVDRKKQIEEASEILHKLNYHIDPIKKVSELKVGERQIVEIAKALAEEELKILIMDEPTSSLSNAEVEVLLDVVRDLKEMGITILYISHKLEEVLSISDYVTVLRDGKLVAHEKADQINLEWIAEQMIGKQGQNNYQNSEKQIGENILEVQNLSLFEPERGKILENINFELKECEILGFFGLLGSGRTEVLECLMGLRNGVTGNVVFENKIIKNFNIRDQISRGFYLVPEDRQGQGLIRTRSILKNLSLSSESKYATAGVSSNKKRQQAIDNMVEDLQIKIGKTSDLITSLSGGNQQKVVIGKGLLTNPSVLLLDEPTKGVDIGAKHELYKIISELSAKQKLSIIFVSSETEEILSVSDRIVVLAQGKVSGVYEGEDMTKENILRAASAK